MFMFFFFFLQINHRLNKVIALIRGAAVGNGPSLSLRFRFLIPMILRNVHSALGAKPLCELFVELRKCVFPPNKELLGVFIAYLSLRYIKPKCEINKAWTEEDLGMLFTSNF